MSPGGATRISLSIDGNATSRSLGDTPTPFSASPRAVAAQLRADEASSAADIAQTVSYTTSASCHISQLFVSVCSRF